MKRRAFLRTSAAAGLMAWSRPLNGRPTAQRALIVRGGTVYDGTGAAPVPADVRVEGDRIVAVARNLPVANADVLEVRGLAVAPGFIDIHSHTDTVLYSSPRAESKVRQGVTTEVAGQDGGSVAPSAASSVLRSDVPADRRTLGAFFRSLETRGAAVNLASMVGAGTVRGLVMGSDDRRATDAEMAAMKQHVRQAIQDGACGLSSGLEYTPGGFADRFELTALASELRGTGLPYATHMRNEDDQLFASIEEALFVGRMANVPVQISHLKAQGERNWWKADSALGMIEKARASGIDVHFDRYPYIAYATSLSNLFPLWSRDGGNDAFRARLQDAAQRPRIESYVRDKVVQLGSWDAVMVTSVVSEAQSWARGARLGALSGQRGKDPYELLLEIMLEGGGGMVGFGMSEENTAKILAHPLGMVCSDAGARSAEGAQGSVHPRTYGSFPRVLGHYVRDKKVMPLERAIHKMTAMPANKLRLEGRGRITPGAFADLVVFDPERVADRATFEQPHQYPVGIPHVLVNGQFVLRDGTHTGQLPGRVVVPRRS